MPLTVLYATTDDALESAIDAINAKHSENVGVVVTRTKAAAFLNVSEQIVTLYVKNGKITPCEEHFGSYQFFFMHDLIQLKESMKKKHF